MKKSTDSQQAPAIPLAVQNQSRLLPRWLPLHRCVAPGCDQSGAFDRTDGRCYFHGKIADGKLSRWVEGEVGRPGLEMYRNSQGRINRGGVSTPHQRKLRGAA